MHAVDEIVILPVVRESRRESAYGFQGTYVHEPVRRHHERHLHYQRVVGATTETSRLLAANGLYKLWSTRFPILSNRSFVHQS